MTGCAAGRRAANKPSHVRYTPRYSVSGKHCVSGEGHGACLNPAPIFEHAVHFHGNNIIPEGICTLFVVCIYLHKGRVPLKPLGH